jgi:outer membrane protein TolC
VQLDLAGAELPSPPKDQWQAALAVEQLLFDAGNVAARNSVEAARLNESLAALAVSRYELRREVNDAFFAAWQLQERSSELQLVVADLAARLAHARARVAEGVALPADTAAIEIERLAMLRSLRDTDSQRSATLRVLTQITGSLIDSTTAMALPSWGSQIAAIDPGAIESLRHRPEFDLFNSSRERLLREAQIASLANKPRITAFGEGGVGRPGLDQFRTDPDAFWIAGVRMEWRPFDWGATTDNRRALQLQAELLEADEARLAAALSRAVMADQQRIEELRAGFDTDRRIVLLREVVERSSRAQYEEGIIPVTEYLAARTALLNARLEFQRHRAALAAAEAGFLYTLGIPIESGS